MNPIGCFHSMIMIKAAESEKAPVISLTAVRSLSSPYSVLPTRACFVTGTLQVTRLRL